MNDYFKYLIVRNIAENNGGGSSGDGGGCVTAIALFFGAIFIFLCLITSDEGLILLGLIALTTIAMILYKVFKLIKSDKQVQNTFIKILFFSFLFVGGVLAFQYFFNYSPSAIEQKSNEIIDAINAGDYDQAFKLAEIHFPDYPESSEWREKIKNSMPQKMHLEQFPEDYIKLVVVVDETRSKENGQWHIYFSVEDLIYENTSAYDVEITSLSYYGTSGITVYHFNETLKRHSSKGKDTYTDGKYSVHNGFIVKNGTVESVSYDFKILE